MLFYKNKNGEVFSADEGFSFKNAEKIDKAEYDSAMSRDSDIRTNALKDFEIRSKEFIENRRSVLASEGLSEKVINILIPVVSK